MTTPKNQKVIIMSNAQNTASFKTLASTVAGYKRVAKDYWHSNISADRMYNVHMTVYANTYTNIHGHLDGEEMFSMTITEI